MDTESFTAPAPPVGVIESLTQGFETIAARLTLVALPLLLGLVLWVGPRISFAPAIDTIVNGYYSQLWKPFVVSVNPDMDAQWPQLADMMRTALGDTFTQYIPVIGLPALLAGREAKPLPFDYQPAVWEIDTPLGLLGFRLAMLAVGLVLVSVYVALIAQQVQNGEIRLAAMFRRLPVQALWLTLLAIALPVLLVIIYMPFAFMAVGFAMFSQFLSAVVDWAGRLLVLWLVLFLVFTIHGIFMNGRGLLGALWDSVRVVQWNMSATMLLLLLILAINLALGYVWSLPPTGSWLAVVGIMGHALISTALIAATCVFFKDRYRYWREMRAELLMELERRRAQQGNEQP